MSLVAPDIIQKKDINAEAFFLETKDGQLKSHCTTAEQRTITNSRNLSRTAMNVWLRDEYTLGNTPYERRLLESMLIQTYGQMVKEEDTCETCTKGNGMYAHCIRLPGHFGGACGNCKRGDRGAKCTTRDVDGNTKLDRDDEMEMVERGTPARALRTRDTMQKKYPA